MVIALWCSGCTLMFHAGWPKQTLREKVEREATVDVRTIPAGGTVTPGHGASLGQAPVRYRTIYLARREYQRTPMTGILVGVALDMIAGGFFLVRAIGAADRQEWMVDFGLAAAGFLGATSVSLYFIQTKPDNARATANSPVTPIPRDAELIVTWPGWAPTRVTARIPDDRHLTVRRPTLGTFEEAVVKWARNPGREVTADEAYHAGLALAKLAERGAEARDVARAIELLSQALAAPELTAERRGEVTALLARLQARAP